MASSTAVAVALLLLVAAAADLASAGISCRTVVSKITPCYSYVVGKEAGPSGACCSGISYLKWAARSTQDRQMACMCLKRLAGSIRGQRAASLPGKCRVRIPYPISASVNCNTIK